MDDLYTYVINVTINMTRSFIGCTSTSKIYTRKKFRAGKRV